MKYILQSFDFLLTQWGFDSWFKFIRFIIILLAIKNVHFSSSNTLRIGEEITVTQWNVEL